MKPKPELRQSPRASLRGPTRHVLIVEDDAAIRTAMADALADEGYCVAVADNGHNALMEMRAHLPDLILLDLMLPDMSGWSFLDAHQRDQDFEEVPVLVVSAARAAGLREAQELGAPLILNKPFSIEQLLALVERLCARPVRQCAWCARVVDEAGAFRLHSGRNLRWATHGICAACSEAERRTLVDQLADSRQRLRST